jgi:hypothetical protein
MNTIKKNLQKILVAISVIFFTCNLSYAQHWGTNGNNAWPPPDNINATSYIGTNVTVPFQLKTMLSQPINFFTNNVQRMTIRGQVGITQGFVGIGTNFTNPRSLLHINDGILDT